MPEFTNTAISASVGARRRAGMLSAATVSAWPSLG